MKRNTHLKKAKLTVTFTSLLFSLPFLNLFALKPIKVTFFEMYRIPIDVYQFSDVYTYILMVPFAIFSLSIVFYFTNRGHYFTWLIWTVICTGLFSIAVMSDNPRDMFRELVYVAVLFIYLTGCVFLLIMAGIWKLTEKERMPKQQ